MAEQHHDEDATPLADTRRAQIAARRYRQECRGIIIAGLRYATDRASQGRITSAVLAARQAQELEQPFSVRWKTADGWAELDAAGVIAFGNAALAYVQACFDREQALLGALEAGTYTDAMLGTGWPDSEVQAP